MEKKIEDAIKNELANVDKLINSGQFSPQFVMAGLVFKKVLSNLEDIQNDPNDDILDYYFKAYDYEFAEFCDDFAAAVYQSIETPIAKKAHDTSNLEDDLKWNKFSGVFNCANFSEILQENLLTRNCVDTFEKCGDKVVMIKCHKLVWAFANFYAPKWLRDKIRTN